LPTCNQVNITKANEKNQLPSLSTRFENIFQYEGMVIEMKSVLLTVLFLSSVSYATELPIITCTSFLKEVIGHDLSSRVCQGVRTSEAAEGTILCVEDLKEEVGHELASKVCRNLQTVEDAKVSVDCVKTLKEQVGYENAATSCSKGTL
jgi:hypothetical protein